MSKPKLSLNTLLKIIETPITPPSMMSFGDKKDPSAKPVIIAPKVIKINFLIFFFDQ